jgi:hypothetical protein
MKVKLALLFCGVGLLATLPVRADSIPYSGASNDFPGTVFSATVAPNPDSESKAPVKVGFLLAPVPAARAWADLSSYPALAEESANIAVPGAVLHSSHLRAIIDIPAEPTPVAALAGSPVASNAFGFWGSGGSVASDLLLRSPSDTAATALLPTSVDETGTHQLASSISGVAKEWNEGGKVDGLGFTGDHRRSADSTLPVSVPEPGSLSFFLLGLAAVALLGRKSRLANS